jgi:3-methyladenine DNA glycosylase Mpg
MTRWPTLLHSSENVDESLLAERWFAPVAKTLLGCALHVGSQSFRLMEIEFYYYSEQHPDAFSHRNPIQHHTGRWYFHRSGSSYRGGSFKGLDVSFGSRDTFGGILIRSMEAEDGRVIAGPSLCVDQVLSATGAASVADLDRAIGEKLAWERDNPVLLGPPSTDAPVIFQSARVGLSLKKVSRTATSFRYLMRPYRYLVEPHRISKGKLHVVLALHARGVGIEKIYEMTRCPKKSIRAYIDAHEAGRGQADFSPYCGIDLSPLDLCRLHGLWQNSRS